MSFLADIQEYYRAPQELPEEDPATPKQLHFIWSLLLDQSSPTKQVEQWVHFKLRDPKVSDANAIIDMLLSYVPPRDMGQRQIVQFLEERAMRDK